MASSDPRPGTRISRAYWFQYVCLVFIRVGPRTALWAETLSIALSAGCVHGKCNVLFVLTWLLSWRFYCHLRPAWRGRRIPDSEPQAVRGTVQERDWKHHLYRGDQLIYHWVFSRHRQLGAYRWLVGWIDLYFIRRSLMGN